jgi:phage FluMu gp28-like protein
MNNFLIRYYLPRVKQGRIINLNRPIIPKEKEEIIRSFTTKKSPRPDDFSTEFYQTFKQVNANTPQTILQNRNRRNIAQFFYEATVTLISKPHKDSTKKEKCKPISLINMDFKILKKYLETKSKNTSKKASMMIK